MSEKYVTSHFSEKITSDWQTPVTVLWLIQTTCIMSNVGKPSFPFSVPAAALTQPQPGPCSCSEAGDTAEEFALAEPPHS